MAPGEELVFRSIATDYVPEIVIAEKGKRISVNDLAKLWVSVVVEAERTE